MNKPPYLLPAASHHELTEYCVYPWNGGVRWPERGPMAPAQRYGVAFHEGAADVLHGFPEPVVNVVELGKRWELPEGELRRLSSAILRLAVVLEEDGFTGDATVAYGAETGFAYSTTTGRTRPCADRKEKAPDEIYGAADLVFWRADGRLVVRDWKTGEKARGKRPGETRQLRFLAMAASHVLNASEVRVELAFVDEDADEVVGDDLDALELGAVEGELAELVERLEAPPAPKPGPWCERYFCPLRAVCPATLAAMAGIEANLERFPLLGALDSPEHAAFIRHRLPVLRDLLDQREEDVQAFARRYGPLPVEGQADVVWGPREHEGRERIEATPEAVRIVRERLGAKGADEALEVSVSKASLERGAKVVINEANGGKVPRGAMKATMEPLLEDLRRAKAVKKGSAYTRFEEFKRPTAEEGSADG
jgi:hypothetical protein